MYTPIKEWLIHNLDPNNAERNNRWPTAFDRENEIPLRPVEFVRDRIQEVERAWERGNVWHLNAKPRRMELMVQWEAPPKHWTILNTDGAARVTPDLLGVGGCYEEAEGN